MRIFYIFSSSLLITSIVLFAAWRALAQSQSSEYFKGRTAMGMIQPAKMSGVTQKFWAETRRHSNGFQNCNFCPIYHQFSLVLSRVVTVSLKFANPTVCQLNGLPTLDSLKKYKYISVLLGVPQWSVMWVRVLYIRAEWLFFPVADDPQANKGSIAVYLNNQLLSEQRIFI